MTKKTITIGIPAYNEEKNVKQLLTRLLQQKQDNFSLKEIIVISDGSDDNTEKEVLSLKNRLIKLVVHKKRVGQAISQNEILKRFSEEILVLLNADILPSNDEFLNNIVIPFETDSNVGIVGGKVSPVKGSTFIENVINHSVKMKEIMYKKLNSGENIYHCHGRARAFSKKFAKTLQWPSIASEDAYSYLECIKHGFTFVYAPKAEVLYGSPQNINDHLKQSVRFIQSQPNLEKYFSVKTLEQAYAIPIILQITLSFKYLLHHPIYFVSYLYLLLLANIFARNFFSPSHKWAPAESSKEITVKKKAY